MLRFHTCVCSTLHLPGEERRLIESLVAMSREGQSLIEYTDLTIVPHHDGYMIHVGVVEDRADRPANVPAALWQLLGRACEEGASWLSFDREELPCSDLPVYPDDSLPDPVSAIGIRCEACGSADVERDAWAQWNEPAQAWTLGSVFDAAFCNVCEADATLIETPLPPMPVETAA
ncbi:hypothetical protein QLH51_05695 [Sphingomonas sp. 2R-10]|nr:hypothetical protein [Sphingomonas sp. 2R-10]